MYLVSVQEVKKNLNIDDSFTDDDNYISNIIDVAYYAIKNQCFNNFWIDQSGNTSGSTLNLSGQTDIPLPIKHAIILLSSHYYETRQPVSFGNPQKIPYTVDYLIQPYINYNVTE